MRFIVKLGSAALVLAVVASGVNAQVSTSIIVPGETGSFSDGTNDYFGLVDATGTMIAGTTFTANWGTTPPASTAMASTLAGRDHDDNNSKPATRTATWTLPVGPGNLTNVQFNGTLAAADATSPSAGNNWFVPGSVMFELQVSGLTVASAVYSPLADFSALALGGVGPPVADTGTAVMLTTPDVMGATSLTVLLTATSDSGNEEWWVTGTLSAGSVPVELQSFSIGEVDGEGDEEQSR